MLKQAQPRGGGCCKMEGTFDLFIWLIVWTVLLGGRKDVGVDGENCGAGPGMGGAAQEFFRKVLDSHHIRKTGVASSNWGGRRVGGKSSPFGKKKESPLHVKQTKSTL